MIPSLTLSATGAVMMGRQTVDQSQLFYLFNLEEHIPADHLLRRLNPIVTRVLVDVREKLAPFHSDIGRPSIDPELMIRMLIVGYCYGIRFDRKLCEEVKLHLGYRWFCRVELDDKVPDHSTFSVNRHGRFRDSNLFRQLFEAVVRACMNAGLVKGEGFAVDASVMEADASRYHGKAPDEIDWSAPERQTRAVAEWAEPRTVSEFRLQRETTGKMAGNSRVAEIPWLDLPMKYTFSDTFSR